MATAERIRAAAASANRTLLTDLQTQQLLSVFDLPVTRADAADTLKEALAAARKIGYPVTLKLDAPGLTAKSPLPLARTNLRDGRMLTRAYGELQDGVRRAFSREDIHAGVIVRKEVRLAETHDVAIGVHTDAAFGPVITFGNSGAIADSERVVLLPPLNERLVLDAIGGTRAAKALRAGRDLAPSFGPLVRVLLQVSSLVCALPWVRTLTLDPVRVGDEGTVIAGAHVAIDLRRRFVALGYRHMAIHPYPIELVGDATLRDGTTLHVRPIRPEDAELERAFVNGLSEETRYFRFFYRLHELTPAMLARFTQVDYDREMALVGDRRWRRGEGRRGICRGRAVHDQSGRRERRVCDRRRRCMAGTRRWPAPDAAPDRLREAARPVAARRNRAARQRQHAEILRSARVRRAR